MESRDGGRGTLGLLLLWALVAVGCYLAVAAYLLDGRLGFPLDDSWIHLQFARNLAAGRGLAYNPGQWVTGSTSPLWTGILSLGFLIPGGALIWARLVGIVLYALTGWATWRLGKAVGLSPALALFGAFLTLATSWLIWGALSAMEIPLFTLLSVLGVTMHIRERREPSRPPLSLGVFGLSVLARPEGVLLVLAAIVDRLLQPSRNREGAVSSRRLRTLVVGLGWVALALGPTLIFYKLVGGAFLPTTFAAKAGGLQRWIPSLNYVRVVVGVLFLAQPVPTLLAAGGGISVLKRWGTDDDVGLLPVLWPIGLPFAYSLLSPPSPDLVVGNFGRYFFPLFPFVVVLATVALDPLFRAWSERTSESAGRRAVATLLLVLIALPTLTAAAGGAMRFARHVGNVNDGDVAAALWLRPRVPADAVIAVNDIGALKYLLPNSVVDLAGILDPRLVAMEHQAQRTTGNWQAGVQEYLEITRPDYAVVFPSWYPNLVGPDKLLQPVHALRVADNEALGGDVVVICRTPWTRYPLKEP